MHCTTELLDEFITRYGWAYERVDESTWLTGWTGSSAEYPLMIHLNDTAVLFEVRPFLDRSIDWKMHPELMIRLMELNDETQIVKLSFSKDGDLILAAHSLTLYFGYENFTYLIGILAYYADALPLEIFSPALFRLESRGEKSFFLN
jgi:hypothetical protein